MIGEFTAAPDLIRGLDRLRADIEVPAQGRDSVTDGGCA